MQLVEFTLFVFKLSVFSPGCLYFEYAGLRLTAKKCRVVMDWLEVPLKDNKVANQKKDKGKST